MTFELNGLLDVRFVDGLYRITKKNGLSLSMTADEWREALQQIEILESESEGDWLE